MKKLACLFAAAVLLAGCGGGAAATKTGKAESKPNDKNQVTTAEVTMEGDKITKVSINDTYEKDGKATTKKDLKEGYGMKSASAIGKEWFEQIEFLEKFIAEKGIDKVGALDSEGKPTNTDVLAGCTMGIQSYVDTVNAAVNAAK